MTVVVDANLCLACALPMPYSPQATARMAAWAALGTDLFAPSLWSYEVVSALRKWVAANRIDQATAERTLNNLLGLGIREIPPSPERHRSALRWAARLGQPVAYDGAYLALAEEMGAELWTADQRLVAGARAAGAVRVRHLTHHVEEPC